MYLSAQNLKCHVAAREHGRFPLHSIALTEHGTVSTDGRLLLFIPYPSVDPKDIPGVEGMKNTPMPKALILIDPEDAKRAADMAPKRPLCPAHALVHIEPESNPDGEDRFTFGVTDGRRTQKMTARKVEGSFPDYPCVIPDYTTCHAVTFDIKMLARAIKTLEAASNGTLVTIRLVKHDIGVGFSTDDGVGLIVMPILDVEEGHVPDVVSTLKQDPSPKQEESPSEEDEEDQEIEKDFEEAA